MFVEELPSLRPLIVLLLVSVAIRPVAFVHVEFVGGIAAGNKIDNRALEVSASIALEGITRDYKSLTWYNKFESFSWTACTTLECPVNSTGAPRSGTQNCPIPVSLTTGSRFVQLNDASRLSFALNGQAALRMCTLQFNWKVADG